MTMLSDTNRSKLTSLKFDALSRIFCDAGNLFFIFWLIAGVAIAVFTPPNTGMDEPMHIARALQVAQGKFLPQDVNFDDIDESIVCVGEEYSQNRICGGETDKAIYDLLCIKLPSTREEVYENYKRPYWEDEKYNLDESIGDQSVIWAFQNTAINSPLCYLPYSIAYLIITFFSRNPIIAIIVMRICGVVVFGILVRFAIRNSPVCKHVMMLTAMLPNCFAVCTMVSADMMTLAFSLTYFSYILKFIFRFSQINKNDYVGLGISLCGLSLLKMPCIMFGLLIFVPFISNRMWKIAHQTLAFSIIGFSALTLFLTWCCVIRGIDTYIIWGVVDVDVERQLSFILMNPGKVTAEVVSNVLGSDLGLLAASAYLSKTYPSWIILAGILCCVYTDIQDIYNRQIRLGVWSRRLVVLSLLMISCLFIVVVEISLFLTFTTVGGSQIAGVQSRYFMPIVYLILVSAALFGSRFISGTYSGKHGLKLSSFDLPEERFPQASVPMTLIAIAFSACALRMFSIWLPL